jgi:hypothetical protein
VSAAPVFVIGVARSGTNLMARILSRHPDIQVALDPLLPVFRALRNAVIARGVAPDVAARFRPDSPFHDYYFDPDGPALLDAVLGGTADLPVERAELAGLQASVTRRAAVESPVLGRRLAAIAGRTYTELLTNAFAIIADASQPVSHVAIKEVWIFEFIPLLAAAFPTASFFIIERDPRAIVASLLAMARRDPTQAAHVPSYARHWRKSITLARHFAADPLLRDRMCVMTYETLAREPEVGARAMCANLGLPFDAAMLDLSAGGWTGNSSYDGVGPDVYVTSAERWRGHLPDAVARGVEALCAPEMVLTEYRPQGPGGLDRAAFEWLQAADEHPGSWRSDAGDALVDIGGELLRHFVLAHDVNADTTTVRRCFLFEEALITIRRTLASPSHTVPAPV